MENPICTDCKVELELIDCIHSEDQEIGCEEYYRCPRCKAEFDVDDVIEN